MPTSLTTSTVRRRIGVSAAGLVAVGALLAPGVAWADNAIPQGGAVAVHTVEPMVTGATADAPECGMATIQLSEEEVRKMVADGRAVPATPLVPSTPSVSAGPAVAATPTVPADAAPTGVLSADKVQQFIGGVQQLFGAGAVRPDATAADVPAQAVQLLTATLGQDAPAGALAVTRSC
ncbi:hypothetical protein [Rhodococcus sp. NPDC059234]|uniref:hypothetical protein n=1 Tax=Rhodococcus sp. NPDC059234 TaxID=3346781 RepID=UPI003671C017